jgi:dsRNA-specific ribonuclease
LIISSDFEKRKSRTNTKLLKDVFEAFIGAMYLDFNKKPQLNLESKGYFPF